jgi:hypothetical protein
METLTKRPSRVIVDPVLLGEMLRSRIEVESKVVSPLRINLLAEYGGIYLTKEYADCEMDYIPIRKEYTHRLYVRLRAALERGRRVVISFAGTHRKDPQLFMESICALYHDFPVETVEDLIESTDLEGGDADTLSEMKEDSRLELYNPRLYAELFKIRCESTDDIRYMKESEKIWLKYGS